MKDKTVTVGVSSRDDDGVITDKVRVTTTSSDSKNWLSNFHYVPYWFVLNYG